MGSSEHVQARIKEANNCIGFFAVSRALHVLRSCSTSIREVSHLTPVRVYGNRRLWRWTRVLVERVFWLWTLLRRMAADPWRLCTDGN